MKVNLGIWEKLTRTIWVLLLFAILLGIVIWYLPLILQNERMRKEIFHLKQEIQHEEEITRQLTNSVYAIQNDSNTVERLAREKLGYAKPGEIVIRFETPATNLPKN